MATVLQPPAPLPDELGASLFLAGSIDMGQAEPWQDRVTAALADTSATILNPRRDDWDATWEQSIENPQFVAQVQWELEGLERAAVVAMYFAADAKSIGGLLRLGLVALRPSVVVGCDDDFAARGHVEVVCERYGLTRVSTVDGLAARVRRELDLAIAANG